MTQIKQIWTPRMARMTQQKIQSMRQQLKIKTQIKVGRMEQERMIRHQSLILKLRLIQMP